MKKINIKIKNLVKLTLALFIIVSLSVSPCLSSDIKVLSDTGKKVKIADTTETIVESKTASVDTADTTDESKAEYVAVPPEETTSDDTSKWLLYGGSAALGVGILALAISAIDSDSDSESSVTSVNPVGPDIAGSNWAGTLTISNTGYEGSQGVTAVITQIGRSITITTDSSLSYGQYFSGSISSGGYISVRESVTNQLWTTHNGNASTTAIRLYDYVNNYSSYDTLFMIR